MHHQGQQLFIERRRNPLFLLRVHHCERGKCKEPKRRGGETKNVVCVFSSIHNKQTPCTKNFDTGSLNPCAKKKKSVKKGKGGWCEFSFFVSILFFAFFVFAPYGFNILQAFHKKKGEIKNVSLDAHTYTLGPYSAQELPLLAHTKPSTENIFTSHHQKELSFFLFCKSYPDQGRIHRT